jgi:hypothetical protein
LKEVI